MLLNTGMAQKTSAPVGQRPPADDTNVSFETLLTQTGHERNKESFMALFRYFAPRIKSYFMQGGMNDAHADELAQDTMLAVWQNAERYDPARAKASTWIYTIARNKRVDALRKVHYVTMEDNHPIFEQASDAPEPGDEALARHEEEKLMEELIDALPEEQAVLIRKSFYEDKTHAAIAAETGIPLGTVKSRIRQALDKLRGAEKARALWH